MSADEVESRILAKDDTYCKYLVQRIIDNSPFPSARLIALFDLDYLDRLINGMIISGRMKDRLRLVRSVLFREPREGIRPWIIQ